MQFFFSDHTLDTGTRELRRGDVAIALQPQVFDLLAFLVRNRERVIVVSVLKPWECSFAANFAAPSIRPRRLPGYGTPTAADQRGGGIGLAEIDPN